VPNYLLARVHPYSVRRIKIPPIPLPELAFQI
jgi:hypothetical protein